MILDISEKSPHPVAGPSEGPAQGHSHWRTGFAFSVYASTL